MSEHPHKYEICIFWSAEDEVFVAEVPDLPGCMAHGDTPVDAARNAEDAIALWIDVAKEFERDVPSPSLHRVAG